MYSGSTLHGYSGRLMGAHQKIDRAARRQLDRLLPKDQFPDIKSILHFEGNKGPDAIKRKSPARDEPWHFMRPFDKDDTELIGLIENHHRQLVAALKKSDNVRAAFEAAWLAHAMVDGLTPAHHYPYEEKLVELCSGQGNDRRTTIVKKLIMPGSNVFHSLGNNWRMWGPKGLFTTHAAFEAGIAVMIAPLKLRPAKPSRDELAEFGSQPLADWFRSQAQDVAALRLYDEFYESGWTLPLARQVRDRLMPKLVQAVALAWYGAACEAGLIGAEQA